MEERGAVSHVDSIATPSANVGRIRLAQTLRTRAQTNAYLTPPSNQGFTAHTDSQDVFILQLEGAKRWRVYNVSMEYGLTMDRSCRGPSSPLHLLIYSCKPTTPPMPRAGLTFVAPAVFDQPPIVNPFEKHQIRDGAPL